MVTIFDMAKGVQRTKSPGREMVKARIDDPRPDGIVTLGLQPVVASRPPQARNASVFPALLSKR